MKCLHNSLLRSVTAHATRINGEFEFYAYYYVYKFMRRRQKEGLDPRAEAKVWKSIIPQWEQWISKILLSKRIPKERLPTYLIVSNASDTGWGGYRFPPFDAPRIFSEQWNHNDKDLYINAKELLALHYTTLHRTFHKVVRSEFGSIQNRRSRSFTLNKLVQKILSHVVLVQVQYIRSEDNLADILSRDFETTKSNSRRPID